MRDTKRGIDELHKIIRRNARDQMLYAFIEGMRLRDQSVSVEMCVLAFCERYDVHNLDTATGKALYYRMLHEFRRECQDFKEQLNVDSCLSLIDSLNDAAKLLREQLQIRQ